jgi:NAD(P)-dependent dehydrogenase (short-subunit alcohol dehydrogenase family)
MQLANAVVLITGANRGMLQASRQQLEVNFFGMLRMAQAFAPVLARNGGGALLNVLSIASWLNRPLLGTYGASKSAAWALTNGLRHELRAQGTQVTALHMGFVDTDLTRGIDAPKSTPEAIVRAAFDGLEAGAEEVLADELTRQVKLSLSSPTPAYLGAA